MTASLADGRAAALAFLTSLDDACAERLVPIPGGRAVLDARHPLLWDANHLRVETSEAPDAAALVTAADRHLGALGFRAIVVLDPTVAEELPAAARLRLRGATRAADAARADAHCSGRAAVGIEEVAGEAVSASRVAAARELLGSEQVGRQLASRDALIAAATDVRRSRCWTAGRSRRAASSTAPVP